jgi:hypothetical protein
MDYNRSKYKVKDWRCLAHLHWMINPGLAINELILGQRTPKVILIDKASDKPLMERTYVPCPHCHTKHDGRLWSGKKGTAGKNWFGYYCPECGHIIPCLWNVFSYLILTITFPVWGWFKDSLKQKWLEKQPQRYQGIKTDSLKKISWINVGAIFGGLMFLFFAVALLILMPPSQYLSALFRAFIGSAAAAFFFGVIMKVWLSYKEKKAIKS